ncbi:MAG: transporter [Pseudonocardia sp.]|uniref:MFS transporter n=1 Tax=Pseudonocardia sp. TaxID=60912 RepID=UPI002635F3A6|nr:MFS transporter [Pseudonocardia sp.]MCU1630239.1 transporter [Pseudonocardia sp.]
MANHWAEWSTKKGPRSGGARRPPSDRAGPAGTLSRRCTTSTESRNPAPPDSRLRRTTALCVAAASVEWYDFFLYATASATVFADLYFGALGPTAATLASFATFALAFVARPLGGVVFGFLGDRAGRKVALAAGTVTMGVSTTLIGLLPPYASIGVAAPILLTALRLVQGLALGGQWAGSVLLLTEQAPAGRRGFFGSLAQLGSPIGGIVSNALFFLLSAVLSPAQFSAWGWRIPFLLSVAFVGLGLYVQLRLEESPAFRRIAGAGDRSRTPIVEVLRTRPVQVLLAAGAFVAASASLYVFVTYLLQYAPTVLKVPKQTILLLVTATQAFQMASIPLASAMSDRIGRRRVYLTAAAASAVWAFPAFWLIDTGSVGLIVLALSVAHLVLGAMYGPLAAMFSEMFGTRVRYSGASLGYQLGTVVGGGFAPIIATSLFAATGTSASISGYLVVVSLITLVAVALVRDTSSMDTTAEGARGDEDRGSAVSPSGDHRL